MKRLSTLLSLLATVAAVAAAPALRAAEPAATEITITSARGDFELKDGGLHYRDDVRLAYPGVLDLTCADLVLKLATDDTGKRKLDRITATTNVVMLLVQPATAGAPSLAVKPGETTRATAAMAVFNGADNTVTLTGSAATGQPKVEGAEFTTVADVIVINRATGRFSGQGNHRTTFKAEALKGSSLFSPKTK